jgi:hypothetical protein
MRHSLLTAAGLLCVGGSTLQAHSTVHAGGAATAVAFRGVYTGTSTVDDGYGKAKETIRATGAVTRLTKSRLRSSSTAEINPSGCDPFTGKGRLTGAGGGALTYRFHIWLCFSGAFGRQRQPKATGTYTITGGAGPLQGASGSGMYSEVFQNAENVIGGGVTITFRGMLRL